jgi:hypothetical protein
VVLAALAVAAAAPAATRITKTSYSGNQSFEASLGPQLIDLGEGNGTSLSVETAGSARLSILFNAECAVASPNHTTYLQVEIRVDGSAVGPTLGHALCAGDGDSALNNWITAASDAVVDVAGGTHTIELRGTLFGTGTPGFDWWIGDLSLIVIANDL